MQRVIAMDVKRSHPSQFSINSTNAERQHKAKLNFLNACIYEYVQRVHFHQRIPITGTDIRGKAAEFAGLINFNTFTPNKLWLFDFLKHYKLQIPIERMVIKQRPIMNFEPSQIIAYCRQFLMKARSKVPQTKPLPPSAVAKTPSFNCPPKPKPPVSSQLYMLLNDRKRLDNFKHEQGQILALEKALYEFIQRARYKRVQLSNGLLMRTAGELCHKLQITNFQPTRHWLQHFKNRYDFNVLPATAATSLDLGNILNYCQQHENRNNILTYLGLQQVSTIKTTFSEQSTNVEIICLDDDDEENAGKAEKKFATDLNANNILRGETESTDRNSHIRPPPIKLKPIEALLSPQVLQNLKNTVPLSLPIMPNTTQLPYHQKLDKPAQHTEDPKSIQKPVPAKPVTPVLLRSNAEVLEYLKPLEEFAMLRDNYRVIGILSQLEQILKEKA